MTHLPDLDFHVLRPAGPEHICSLIDGKCVIASLPVPTPALAVAGHPEEPTPTPRPPPASR
jgi:hypothetical protein